MGNIKRKVGEGNWNYALIGRIWGKSGVWESWSVWGKKTDIKSVLGCIFKIMNKVFFDIRKTLSKDSFLCVHLF